MDTKPKTRMKTANPAYAAAIADIRKSNAYGTHQDKRNKRARTRSAQRKKAIQDHS